MKLLNSNFLTVGKGDYFLFHGDQIHFLSKDNHDLVFQEIQSETIIHHKQSFSSFFLGHPYIKSFVHETIQLKKKELHSADAHVLPFSSVPDNLRSVRSIQIDSNKSITIHSHLSEQGKRLLAKYKIRKNWYPLISDFVFQIYKYKKVSDIGKLNILFNSELLTVKLEPGFSVSYFAFLESHMGDQNSKNYFFDHLLSNQTKIPSISNFGQTKTIDLSQGKNCDKKVLYDILSIRKKFRRIKSVVLPFNLSGFSLKKVINVPITLMLMMMILCLWWFQEYQALNHLKANKTELEHKMESLNKHLNHMTRFSKHERQYFKLLALNKAIHQVSIKPEAVLLKIDHILPESVWLIQYSVTSENIKLVLFDREKTEVTSLLDIIDANIGQSSLIANEKSNLNNHPVNRITILIDQKKYETDVN